MKNHYLIIICVAFYFCCTGDDKVFITFSGKIKNNNESIVKVTNYNSTLKQEIAIDSLGNFSGPVLIEKDGYYFFQIGRFYTTVRFEKGYNVDVSIDMDDFFKSISYSGEMKNINNYNVAKAQLRSKQVGNSKEYFVVPLSEFLPKIEKTRDTLFYLLQKSGLDKKDVAIEKKIIEYEYLQTYNNYKKFYTYHKKADPVLPSDYFDPVINMDTDDDEIFRYSRAYRNLIIENYRLTSTSALKDNPNLSIIDFVSNKISSISSLDIKEQISSMLIKQMKVKNKNIENDYKRIMGLLTTKRMKDKLTQRYNSAKSTKTGLASVDFNYENYNGGMTSLKDLRGKLIYIDVWATWCGPCLIEMPDLSKLIKEYSGKNIEFVSISIDSKNNYDKWRKMVKEKDIGGIHLYDAEGLNSDFMKAFSVGLIPRFMMIDEQGKIITGTAPRPSSDNVRNFIDSYLEKPKVMKFTTS